MRVVQLPRRFVRTSWGGTETVILETSKCLLAFGHHTEILCPRALSDTSYELIDGIKVQRFDYFYPYWGLSAPARLQLDKKGGNLFSFPLLRVLSRLPGLDLIHLHTGKRLGAIGKYVAAERNLPYVISLHGGAYDVPASESQSLVAPTKGTFEWGKALGWWFGARRVLDDAAAILCAGEKERGEVQRHHPHKKVIYLPNGVNVDRFARGDGAGFRARHGIRADAFVILIVGRIDPQKNQLLAVRLLAQLLRDNMPVHLVLVGPVTDADYNAQLQSQIAALQVNDRVMVVRGLDTHDQELVEAYHAADLFLLPSVHEPFGIVILEAWAAGLPVAASCIGGVPSFVSDGEDGCLFPPGDLDVLARLVKDLIANPDARRKFGNAGKKKACAEFSWDGITKRLLKIYEEAIRENSFHK